MILERSPFSGPPEELAALNTRWRALARGVLLALPQAQVLEVRCRTQGGVLVQGVSVYDAGSGALDLEPLAGMWDALLAECLEVLGPGWFSLRQSEVFRLVTSRS